MLHLPGAMLPARQRLRLSESGFHLFTRLCRAYALPQHRSRSVLFHDDAAIFAMEDFAAARERE